MSEWVLVPVEATTEMAQKATQVVPTWDDTISATKYAAMLAARPPVPRSVWDAMVERGIQPIAAILCGQDSRCHATVCHCEKDTDAALRAALGNPVVEVAEP